MIVDVGTQREVDWFSPLVAVAGERARVQIEQLGFTRDTIIERLGVSSEQLDSFIKNWAEPLAMLEAPSVQDQRNADVKAKKNTRICNCRANFAARNYSETFAVLNLIDLIDIICNIGYTEFFFDGAAASHYDWEGVMANIECSSCHGNFTGIIFDKQWDGDSYVGERVITPVISLVTDGLPFFPFTQSWAYSAWDEEAKLYNSLGWDSNLFTQMIRELSGNSIALDSSFGTNWNPNANKWSEEAVRRRFDLWTIAGADELHAAMGILLERTSYQHSGIPAPTPEMIEIINDSAERDKLVQHLNWYINEVKKHPLVGLAKHVSFANHVAMAKYDIDPNFLDMIR